MFFKRKSRKTTPPEAVSQPPSVETAPAPSVEAAHDAAPVSGLPPFQKRFSFGAGNEATALLKDGWSAPERWGVWSDGSSATLELPLEGVGARDLSLVISAHAFVKPPGVTTQEAKVFVGERQLDSIDWASSDIRESTVAVPAGMLEGRTHLPVRLEIPTAVAPSSLGVSEDARALGVGLRAITLRAD